MIRSAILAWSFCGSFALSCSFIRWMLPFPAVPLVSEKLAHLAAHRDDYDTLFLGSSRTRWDISPAIFDRCAREAGVPCRSFNFGIDGMFAPEDGFVAEHIFALRPAALRRVFIEVSMFLPEGGAPDPAALRSIYWRDWPRTALIWRHLAGSPRQSRRSAAPRWEKWAALAPHVRAFAMRFANVGRGAQLLAPAPSAPEALGPAQDGFLPIERTGGDSAAYTRALAERRRTPARKMALSAAASASLEAIIAAVRAAHAEPILLIAPDASPVRFYPRDESSARILDFTDVAVWPELFAPEHRLDVSHLNRAGAEIFTRRLAAQCFGER